MDYYEAMLAKTTQNTEDDGYFQAMLERLVRK